MTKGEYRVGINFNPSNGDIVAMIKRAAADLIDKIEIIEVTGINEFSTIDHMDRLNEVNRLKALAQTKIEEGAMWAVKAATKPLPEYK
jgi:hypothetical protein